MSVPQTRGLADAVGLVSGSDGVLRGVRDSGRVFPGLPHVRGWSLMSFVGVLAGATASLMVVDWLRVLFVRVAR